MKEHFPIHLNRLSGESHRYDASQECQPKEHVSRQNSTARTLLLDVYDARLGHMGKKVPTCLTSQWKVGSEPIQEPSDSALLARLVAVKSVLSTVLCMLLASAWSLF